MIQDEAIVAADENESRHHEASDHQNGDGQQPDGQHLNGQHDNGHQGPSGEGGRRRRRRRGRRGGRNRESGAQETSAFVPEADRFGVPDEIDTTPTSTVHAPGAPSAPVWSLQDDIPDTTPKEEPPKPVKKGWWQRTFSGDK